MEDAAATRSLGAMSHQPLGQSVDPHDVLALDALLDDEERLLRDTVRQFVTDRILPDVGEWFDAGYNWSF